MIRRRRRGRACATAWLALGLAACSVAPLQSSHPPDLACSLPSNCVNSLGTGQLPPLRFVGPPAAALSALRATLATFPEAAIQATSPTALQVIFSSSLGLRDEVIFSFDAAAQSIHFRSRSVVGVFDFRQNYSRMAEFSRRFKARQQP